MSLFVDYITDGSNSIGFPGYFEQLWTSTSNCTLCSYKKEGQRKLIEITDCKKKV